MSISIKQQLYGEQAFFRQENYRNVTQQELASPKPLDAPAYAYNTESKIRKYIQLFFWPIFGLYQALHSLVGRIVVIASSPSILEGVHNNQIREAIKKLQGDPSQLFERYRWKNPNEKRQGINIDGRWKFKRISVKVDGETIDACMMGTEDTLGNGRWILVSNGNGTFYEDILSKDAYKLFASEMKANLLFYNYPGVGCSSGRPNRNGMVKSQKAMQRLLEDKKRGVGANTIIGYGHSIGGAVQAEALQSHPLENDVRYLFIKSRTFSDLSTVVANMMPTTNSLPLKLVFKVVYMTASYFVKLLGWNLSCVRSSQELKALEIILQTTKSSNYQKITDRGTIVHDDVIPQKAALATRLLEDPERTFVSKCFLGILETHNHGFNPDPLAEHANEMLQKSPSS